MQAFYFSAFQEAATAFYSAFEMCDLMLMDSVWASGTVSCIHPGGLPLIGREEVMASWEQILDDAQPPVIHIQELQIIEAEDLVVQLVAEELAADHYPDTPRSLVLATNVFVREPAGWRIQLHHSSVPQQPEQEIFASSIATPNTLQ